MFWVKSKLAIPLIAIITSGLLLIIRLVGIRIAIVRPDRIGHLAGEIDLYLRRATMGLAPKRLIIITGPACNTELVKIYKRYVSIYESGVIYRFLSLASRFTTRSSILYPLKMTTREYAIFEQCQSVISLTPAEVLQGYHEIEQKFGIKEDDWWVCFHSRDGNYLSANTPVDMSYHDFRDFDIYDMLEAMDDVTSKGGYAIRIGSSPENMLHTTNPKIIDYSFNGRTDFLDIFFCSEALFFIGNTSGPFHLAKLFDTPYAICNLLGYGHLTPLPKTLVITKKLIDPDGRLLSYADCKKLGMFDETLSGMFYNSSIYQKSNLTIVNNSSEEIKLLTRDMFDLVGGKTASIEVAYTQRRFKDNYFDYSLDRHSAGNIAPSFIKSNPQLFK